MLRWPGRTSHAERSAVAVSSQRRTARKQTTCAATEACSLGRPHQAHASRAPRTGAGSRSRGRAIAANAGRATTRPKCLRPVLWPVHAEPGRRRLRLLRDFIKRPLPASAWLRKPLRKAWHRLQHGHETGRFQGVVDVLWQRAGQAQSLHIVQTRDDQADHVTGSVDQRPAGVARLHCRTDLEAPRIIVEA